MASCLCESVCVYELGHVFFYYFWFLFVWTHFRLRYNSNAACVFICISLYIYLQSLLLWFVLLLLLLFKLTAIQFKHQIQNWNWEKKRNETPLSLATTSHSECTTLKHMQTFCTKYSCIQPYMYSYIYKRSYWKFPLNQQKTIFYRNKFSCWENLFYLR